VNATGERTELLDLFARAGRMVIERPMVFIPAVIPSFWAFIAPIAGLINPAFTASYIRFGPGAWRLLGYLLVYIVLLAISQGATVVMVRNLAGGEKADLASGFGEAFARVGPLLGASFTEGVIISLASLLLVFPGLVAAFFLWFVVQSVVIDSESVLGALRSSFRLVATYPGETFLIILATLIVGFALGSIPVVGGLLMIPVTTYFVTLSTLFYLGRET